MSTRPLLAMALATVLLAAGCDSNPIARTEGEVRIWLHDSSWFTGGEDANLYGTLVYDRDNRCMYLASGDQLDPVIWPAGTRIKDDDPVVLGLRSGVEATEGDEVEGGGGGHRPDRFGDLIPEECHGTSGQVVVFNADSRIEVTRP